MLYAGAAPGNHIHFLAEQLFPELKFILVDPAPFACRQTKQITIRNVTARAYTAAWDGACFAPSFLQFDSLRSPPVLCVPLHVH